MTVQEVQEAVIEQTEGKDVLLKGHIVQLDRKENKKKEPFYRLVLRDSSGSGSAFVWNDHPMFETVSSLKEGDYVQAIAKVEVNGEYRNIDLKAVQKTEPPVDGFVDIRGLKRELAKHIHRFEDKDLSNLVLNILNRPDVNSRFFMAPATTISGYSFDGGILASVVRLLRLISGASAIFDKWPHNRDDVKATLDRNFMKAIAIMEPVGKAIAYEKRSGRVEKTREGEFFEELYLTIKIVNEEMDKLEFPAEKREMVEHALGSAHGRRDWGDLFTARTREAVAFSILWNLNLQMGHYEQLMRSSVPDQEFAKLFQKTVHLGGYGEIERDFEPEVEEDKTPDPF